MKQRITVEHLGELSDEQKVKLEECWKPQVGDWYAAWNMHKKKYSESLYFVVEEDKYYSNEPDKTEKDLPLLSIGQMIELLCKQSELSIDTHKDNFGVAYKQEDGNYISWDKVELVDALWGAIKKVL